MGNLPAVETARLHLERNQVHIWRLEPEPATESSRFASLLSGDERDRAARFRFPHLTHSFVADHGRMRLILGAYSGIAPQDLEFSFNEFGKPDLANYRTPLRFNLSHTKELSVLAICLDAEVGIDVEAVRPMDDWRDIAQSHFSRSEIAALEKTEPADQQNAFFRCWTRKEAFIKAHGRGLSMPLDSFAVSMEAEAPELLECAWDKEETMRWSLLSLDVAARFAGAVAVEGTGWGIRYFDWAADRSALDIPAR
jgi:4'-phosphopantetheinyl transferase